MTVVLLCCSWGKDEDTAAAAAAEDEACAVDGDCFEMVLATTLARVQMIHVMVNRTTVLMIRVMAPRMQKLQVSSIVAAIATKIGNRGPVEISWGVL